MLHPVQVSEAGAAPGHLPTCKATSPVSSRLTRFWAHRVCMVAQLQHGMVHVVDDQHLQSADPGSGKTGSVVLMGKLSCTQRCTKAQL